MPCMLLPCFEGPKEDWFCQLGHPRKIKNLLTYLLTSNPLHFYFNIISKMFTFKVYTFSSSVLKTELSQVRKNKNNN